MKFTTVLSLLIVSTVLLEVLQSPAYAQVEAANDATKTVVTQNGNTLNITGGTEAGANLFHSFQQFGLSQDQIANFTSQPNIQNILGRVVGGDSSIINGKIQVMGGTSNLYLMNPAGIVFGPNASLNVPGSFTATTANAIGFGCGATGIGCNWFNATGSNNYAALLGTPNGFAFSSLQPGAIINAGNLAVGYRQNLTLLGGTVIGTGAISAPGGTVTIAAVPGGNFVSIRQQGSLLSLELPVALPEASARSVNPLPFNPLSLPELLTGGNAAGATGVVVENGVVRLTASGRVIPDAVGSAIVSTPEGAIPERAITAETVNISAFSNVLIGKISGSDSVNLHAARGDVLTDNIIAKGEVILNAKGNILTGKIDNTDDTIHNNDSSKWMGLIKLTSATGNITVSSLKAQQISVETSGIFRATGPYVFKGIVKEKLVVKEHSELFDFLLNQGISREKLENSQTQVEITTDICSGVLRGSLSPRPPVASGLMSWERLTR